MKYTLIPIIRNFRNKPIINLINILGLSVSLVLVIILSAYCYSELTTDAHHTHGDRIFLVQSASNGLFTPAILKENIEIKVPGVQKVVRIAGTWNSPILQAENGNPIESDLIFADSGFFDLFTYKALSGDLSSALDNPLSVVISQELKKKLFGKENALGKTIKYNNEKLLTVSAVVERPVENTFLSFSAVSSIETRKILQPSEQEFSEWGWCNFQTFLLVDKHVNPREVAGNIFSLYPESIQEWVEGINLRPLKDIYFAGLQTFGRDYIVQGDKNKAIVLLFVAALILVVALVNFINISSSQWADRINQTGILKVMGASRFVIFRNLVFESFLLFFISTIISLVLMPGVTTIIQNFTGVNFNIRLIYAPSFFSVVIATTILLSMVFSIIPGLRISASRTVDNLKKSIGSSRRKNFSQGGLVALQMVISIVLIAFAVLVYKQIRFGSDNLVFNQNNTIAIKLTDQLNKELLQDQLKTNPMIQNISFTQFYPGKEVSSWGGVKFQLNGEEHDVYFETFSADENFFKIMGCKLIQGRLYSNDLSKDKNKVVVNEEFLRKFNVENPVGGTFFMNKRNYEITGVIKDFHFKSVEKAIEPLAITNSDYNSYCLASIQVIDFGSLRSTVQEIKQATAKVSPAFPVEISFLDDAVNHMYESEVRFRRIFSLFAISAIIICSLGILAMSIFAAQHRVKEIGIRKVNGAKISEVMVMLNRDFVKWVVTAFIVATPVAYYVMNKWLENFAYKTTLSWWIFVLAGTLALGIAMLTVSWQSWKVATRNPVEALRYE
jgi:putative ABC transport system permease protein